MTKNNDQDGYDDRDETPDPVQDQDGYVQARRLQEIYDIRQQVRDRKIQAKEVAHRDRFKALSMYRAVVESYAETVAPLMQQYDHPALDETLFGYVDLSVPTKQVDNHLRGKEIQAHIRTDTGYEWTPVKSTPQPIYYELHGINSILEIPDPIEHTFTLEGSRRSDTIRETITQQVSADILNKMSWAMTQFLHNDAGLELDVDDSEDKWNIEV